MGSGLNYQQFYSLYSDAHLARVGLGEQILKVERVHALSSMSENSLVLGRLISKDQLVQRQKGSTQMGRISLYATFYIHWFWTVDDTIMSIGFIY